MSFSSNLIANAIGPKVIIKTTKIATELTDILNPVIDGFFHELADRVMGQAESVYDLTGEEGHWEALTAAYVARKDNDLFWLYSRSPALAQERIRKYQKIALKRVSLKLDNGDLIRTFKALHGLKTLGGVTFDVTDEAGTSVVSTTLGFPVNTQGKKRTTFQQTVFEKFDTAKANARNFKTINSIRYRIKLSLWDKLDGHLEDPENILFKNKMPSTYIKLMNRIGHQRPLVGPWLQFYTLSVLPLLVKAYCESFAIQGKTGTAKVTISNRGRNVIL